MGLKISNYFCSVKNFLLNWLWIFKKFPNGTYNKNSWRLLSGRIQLKLVCFFNYESLFLFQNWIWHAQFFFFVWNEVWEEERWLWLGWKKNENSILSTVPKSIIRNIAAFLWYDRQFKKLITVRTKLFQFFRIFYFCKRIEFTQRWIENLTCTFKQPSKWKKLQWHLNLS